MKKIMLIGLCLALAPFVNAQDATAATPGSIYDVPVKPMGDATTTTLAQYKGNVMLIVNVASKCGLTPQYEKLEELNKKYADQGLRVLGFPSNDFKGQEPGTEEEIKQFCESKYNVTFPLYAKVHAKDPKSPLYAYLTQNAPEKGEVQWNFEKFLVSRDGKIVKRFTPKTKPDAPEVIAAIEQELAAK